MIKNKIMSLLLITTSSYSIVNLGYSGQSYDIPEENLQKTINDAIKDFKFDKNEIKNMIKSEVMEQSIGTSELPYVNKVSAYETKNYQIIDQDIINPAGKIWKKKGERMLLNTIQPLDLCFVDGKNKIILKNQIEYFDKVVKKKSNAECVYMVSGRSVLELNKEYYPRLFYPSRKGYEDRFMVKSIPTYIHIEKDKKLVYSFPISMFKHEVKK